MNKKLTVTIGIPAYNESAKIVPLLQSILAQNQKGFSVTSILVVSDGSSDDTASLAKNVRSKKIRVIEGKQNKGRIARRNQIIGLCKTDVLVFLDADGYLENHNSLLFLVSPFLHNKKVGLVSGNPWFIGNNTFLTRCLEIPRDTYLDIRYSIKKGNTVLGCYGAMLALSKNIYKGLIIPNDINADDAYIYFTTLTKGYEFRNAKKARVIHFFVDSWSKHIRRNTRHESAKSELRKYFNEKVDREFYIPRSLFIKAAIKHSLRNPIHAFVIYSVNTYTRILAR